MESFFSLPEYPVIDAHMHPYLATDRNFAFRVPETYEDFFAVQARAGIGLSCGSFNIARGGRDLEKLRECNRKVLEVNQKHPDRFYPGVNVSPLFPEESCVEIEKFYRLGFRWIGELAWYVMGYEKYDLPGMKPILDLAGALQMTVCLHPSSLDDLDRLLASFPRTRIVVAHPETEWGISANYQLAQKHENMLIDLSGSGLFRMGMLRRGVDLLGSERILFGTDYPICNPAMNVAGVMFEELDETERVNILRNNFLRLTGISQC
ncbi:MAG: hypothetical protein E7058_08755 [Lentisphaerae bacterium]|nr:hypothetical protein [Lentisphaerota bacterium]